MARGGARRGARAHGASRGRVCARRAGSRSGSGGQQGSATSAPSGSRSSARSATVAVAHALDEVGVYEYMAGRYDEAERLYAESYALAEELDDPKVAAAVLHSGAVLAQYRGDFAGAPRDAARLPRPAARDPPDDGERFFRVHTVGFVVGEGPGGAPRMYFEETVQLFRRVDAAHAIGYVLAALGDVARAQGLSEPAHERLSESLAHFREARDPWASRSP